jgi:hypothetical protein
MIKRLALIIILLNSFFAESQNWVSVSGGIFDDAVEALMYDSVHNELLISGKFIEHVGNKYIRGICRWNGTRWDSLAGGINTHDTSTPTPFGVVASCIPYQGKLLVSGRFQSIGGVKTNALALWDGSRWDTLPKQAFPSNSNHTISGLFKYNSLIYLHGIFDTISGQKCSGIATWDGVNFNPIILPVSWVGDIPEMVLYKNELYIVGQIYNPGDFSSPLRHIMRFDGVSWNSVGGGIKGFGYTGAGTMAIYNNELFVAGHFSKSDGNSGDNIMKWDGTQWYDVGFGDTPSSFIAVRKLLVNNNKLWAFGIFEEAAGTFASKAAVFDGSKWCGLNDTLSNNISSVAILNDTIYIGGGYRSVNSQPLTYVAKLKYPNLYNQCVNVGLNEISVSDNIKISPNPTTSILNIVNEHNQLQNSIIEIKNYLGQIVFTTPFTSQINLSNLSVGMYFLSIQDKINSKTVKFIKQ